MKFTWLTYWVAVIECDNRRQAAYDRHIQDVIRRKRYRTFESENTREFYRELKLSILLKRHWKENRKGRFFWRLVRIPAHF